jgi:transposase
VSDGGYTAVCTQLGLHRETLRRWVIEAGVEAGTRAGVPRPERDRVAELELENRELRRACEISSAAAASSGRSSTADRRSSRVN